MIRLRSFSLAAFALCTIIIMWSLYNYFFDKTPPYIVFTGVEENSWHSKEIECSIKSSHKGDVLLFIDDKLLCDKFFIRINEIHPFIIPTKNLSNGLHTVKIQVISSKYNHSSTTAKRAFNTDNTPLHVSLIKQEDGYKVLQGRTLHLQFQTNKEIEHASVQLLSKEYGFFPESEKSLIYETFIPIECEQIPNEYLLTVTIVDKVGNTARIDNKMQVVMYPFKKTTMAVSEKKMKEEEELGEDSAQFEQLMQKITHNSPRQKLWKGTFCAPMDIARVTCDYGTIRTTQRKGRYAHKALDVVNAPGSVVWAPQDGIVVMKERFVYTGNTVVIDHGQGVISMFCHLEDFAKINVGDHIRQGNPLGTMGKTGYATGYHLHWEMRVNNMQIDPMQWTKPIF